MKNVSLTVAIILVVVAAGAGFFGGMQYQQMQRRTFTFGTGQGAGRFGGGPGRGFGGAGGQGFRPVMGEIISADSGSITVKLQDGSSKIVMISKTTSINKSAAGTSSDLKTGEKVAVFGTDNSDGSVTAQNVQLNPMMRAGMNPSVTPAK